MATKPRSFSTQFFYHVYNCGVNKNDIFFDRTDYSRFLETLEYYLYNQNLSYAQFKNLTPDKKRLYLLGNRRIPETQRVKIIVYCLMPNHFHLLIRPVMDSGISIYISDISNSYTKYINLKNQRIGNLLQGPFKAKEISTEPSLLQVSRYIHLNPIINQQASLSENLRCPGTEEYSSYLEWIHPERDTFLDRDEISSWLSLFGGSRKYQDFVESKLVIHKPTFGIEDLILE